MLEKFIVEVKKTNKPSTDELNKMGIGREDSISEMKNYTEEYSQDVAQKVKEVKNKRKGKSCGRQIKKLQHLSTGSHRRQSENGEVKDEK